MKGIKDIFIHGEPTSSFVVALVVPETGEKVQNIEEIIQEMDRHGRKEGVRLLN